MPPQRRGFPVPVMDPVRAFLPQAWWNRARDYFVYEVDFNTLAASARNQEQWSVQQGFDFLCLAASEVITTLTGGDVEQSFPEHEVRISDDSSGALWTDGFIHAGNFFGRNVVDGAGLMHLVYPRFVGAGTTVTVEANNLEATARRIWMAFHGVRVSQSIRFDQIGGSR